MWTLARGEPAYVHVHWIFSYPDSAGMEIHRYAFGIRKCVLFIDMSRFERFLRRLSATGNLAAFHTGF